MNESTRFGYVALIGRPNVGKSTLMNCLLGRKISITSRKPQTTRHRILGVKTVDDIQIAYLDTPGLHTEAKRAMNRYMNRAAKMVLHEVDVVIFMVEAGRWLAGDDWVLKHLKEIKVPIILVINKIDKVKDRRQLLPFIEQAAERFTFRNIVPISAKNGDQVPLLEKQIIADLPKEMHLYPPDQITDRGDRFVSAEVIREKLMRLLGQEIPYSLTVTIDALEESKDIVKISAIIWVEKSGQKNIVIGKSGERLKEVGTKARLDLERYFDKKVFVQLWVKVKSGWSDSETDLEQFGYNDE